MTNTDQHAVLSFDDACQYLHVSRDKLRQLIEREGLPAVQFQRLWRIPKKALDDWLIEKAESAAVSRAKAK